MFVAGKIRFQVRSLSIQSRLNVYSVFIPRKLTGPYHNTKLTVTALAIGSFVLGLAVYFCARVPVRLPRLNTGFTLNLY